MAELNRQPQPRANLPARLGAIFLVIVYAVVMVSTNARFTLIDDESNIIANSGHPALETLRLYLAGAGMHDLHPPTTDILLHFWLAATHDSFFALRIFANIFFIAAVLLIARCAGKLAGPRAWWAALILGFVWPFAFQYGRITGWYCYSMFLIAWVTSSYLQVLDDRGYGSWILLGIASLLLVLSNYFGLIVLILLLADFLLFHRDLARRRIWPLLAVMAIVVAAFAPLLSIVFQDVSAWATPLAARMDWKNEFAMAAYPAFSIFASAAIAPWFLPLSVPVALAVLALFVCIWFSPGRRWLVYYVLSMVALDLFGHMSIKRVLFLLPWLFMAMALAAASSASRFPRLAFGALAVIVVCGWVGIISGKHYATTNLYEPWDKVAAVVAPDARHGATIVSGNPAFLLYLNYQLDLQSDTATASGAYLGDDVYRAHGYTILLPDAVEQPQALHGKVVLANGSGYIGEVDDQNAINSALAARCQALGAYRAAPDPAAIWKQRFAKDVPLLAYRTEVFWYDCP